MTQRSIPAGARQKRHKTRHRGITFRETAEGRSYSVYDEGQRKLGRSPYVPVEGGEQEALALQAELRGKKARGERVVLASRRTVRQVGNEWYEAERSSWRDDYSREMKRLLDKEIFDEFGDDRIASIGPNEVISYDRSLRKRGLSESGTANVMKPLRGLCAHAVLAGDIAVSPFQQIPRGKLSSCSTKRQHHEWTSEEVERFIATAHLFDERETAQRSYGDQVELMVRTGLRIAEASGLRFSDVDHSAQVIHVRRQFTKRGKVVEYTKTAAGRRRIPITDELLAKLDFRQSFYALGPDDFVFAEEAGGNPPSHSNFRRRCWHRVVAKTGLKLDEGVRVTPHDARHATASQLADLDLDSDDAAALLGHSSAKVTEGIYIGTFNRDAREERIRQAMERAQNGSES